MAQPLLTLVPKIPSLSLFALKSGLVAARASAMLVMLMRSPGFSSAGSHGRDQPETESGKDDEDRQLHQIGNDEGRNALIDRPDRDIRLDAFEDKDIEAKRRMDETGL